MLSHRRIAALTVAMLVALLAAACEGDRPAKDVAGPPAPTDSAGVAGFLRHTIRVYRDGSVFHESTEVRAVNAVFERGVARVDSGPIVAVLAGAPLSSGSDSFTDDEGHTYTITAATDAAGLPSTASAEQDGQHLGDASFAWALQGDAYILSSQVVSVYYGGSLIAQDESSFSTAQEVRLAPAIRAQQLQDARQHPVTIASGLRQPCTVEWVAYAGASLNLLIGAAIFQAFPPLGVGWIERALVGWVIAIVGLIRCVTGMWM